MKSMPSKYRPYMILSLSALAALTVIWCFHPELSIFSRCAYSSYSYQAEAWLMGRLSLPYGESLTWLEIATYKGQTYISFPPFPSFVMLPFVALFGIGNTPENAVNTAFVILGMFFAYKIARRLGQTESVSVLLSLLLTLCGNFLFVAAAGWVWFLAQVMSFTFTLMAFYYCLTDDFKHTKYAFLFYAFAVGCRPFQAVYFPVLAFLAYRRNKNIKQNLLSLIPMSAVACVYMWLNYARFGNIAEFGHSYLPEMLADQQFGLKFLSQNFKYLWSLPALSSSGLSFNGFGRDAFWIFNTVYVFFAFIIIYRLIRKLSSRESLIGDPVPASGVFVLVCLHIFLLLLHITMGGWGWGSRYLIDTTPGIFYVALNLMPKKPSKTVLAVLILLCVFGLAFNMYGTIVTY